MEDEARVLIYRTFAAKGTPLPPPRGKHRMILRHYQVSVRPYIGETYLDYFRRACPNTPPFKTTEDTWIVE